MPLNNLKVIWLLLVSSRGSGWVCYQAIAQWASVIPVINVPVQVEPKEKGDLTNRRFNHVALCALIGGIVGIGFGFVEDRRRA
jgi:hypothetical protein